MPFFQYRDRHIYYDDQGSGDAMFFIHEWNASSYAFRRLNVKYLVNSARVVSIDLPGFGHSEFVEGLQFDDFSLIIQGLMDHLGIEQCTLVGFCLGAAIAIDMYHRYPHRVRYMILIEPSLSFPKVLLPLLIPGLGPYILKNIARNRFLFSLVSARLIGPDKAINELIFKGLEGNDHKISGHYLQLLYRRTRQGDFRNSDLDIQEKCVCITGENTKALFKSNANILVKQFKISNILIISGTKHYVMMERPAEVARIMLQYMP
jgi:pimeloyl-ACP methyl ester carboxylesterase